MRATSRRTTRTVTRLLVELIEVQLDLFEELRWRVVAALDQHDVVVAESVRHDDEVLAVDLLDEGLVATDVVDVIEVAELLQEGQRVGAAPQPVAVVAHWSLTGGCFDHVARLDQEPLLLVATHR